MCPLWRQGHRLSHFMWLQNTFILFVCKNQIGICILPGENKGDCLSPKVKWSESHSVVSESLWPHGLYSPWNSPGQSTGSPSPGDLPNPGIEPRSPALQEDSLPAEPPGKPKNTGMGSLSLLECIFPTHRLNWSLLHCRKIFYKMSYQGSPSRERKSIVKYQIRWWLFFGGWE